MLLTIRYYLRLLALPLFLLVLFLSLAILWRVVNLPSPEEFFEIIRKWFEAYGFPVIFLSSIVEGVLLVGNYFPGATVVFLGVALTTSILQAVTVVSVVIVGLFIAHVLNYALGKYGWYRLLVRFGLKGLIEKSKEQLEKKGPPAILLSYWLPNLGALTDTAAGIIHMPFKKFLLYSLLSTILWSTFFGTLVYLLKDFVISTVTASGDGLSGMAIIFVIITIWIVVLLIADFFKKRRGPDLPPKTWQVGDNSRMWRSVCF